MAQDNQDSAPVSELLWKQKNTDNFFLAPLWGDSSSGLQDGLFSYQKSQFWRVLLWKISVYFMTIRSILRPLEILYGHLLYFVVIWYIFPRFGILDQEKSGNPAPVLLLTTLNYWNCLPNISLAS
jgi:hypothetical protein